jgi:type II secretory pathway pseudopilin PulG
MRFVRAYLGVIVVLSILAVVALTVLTTSRGDVRRWMGDNYTLVEQTGDRSAIYGSDESASTVVRRIAGRWEPGARHNDSEGWYLRYDDAIVVVTNSANGALIYVDDPTTGYQRWFTHIGGRFGTYSGPAEAFRGGGPGSGK